MNRRLPLPPPSKIALVVSTPHLSSGGPPIRLEIPREIPLVLLSTPLWSVLRESFYILLDPPSTLPTIKPSDLRNPTVQSF
ncbi:hypothetical protein COLO4_20006 [Corchorus olitorius]|uniref:Uncharacterized protein n=1 Tax=Corchorus olitorius TaxID=93759 RepID=A0A1R3J2C0_9ROSI|nr:hypothetical protein COLO4_20006 [Corchorus olitorius]